MSSPITSCGTRCGTSSRTASAFVTTSRKVTMATTGQNSPALPLCIFLPLLALDAIAGVRQCVEPFERDVVPAIVTLPERLRRPIEPPQRLVDVPQEAAFLAGEEKCLLALHRVGALIGHVERVAAQVSIGRLRRG